MKTFLLLLSGFTFPFIIAILFPDMEMWRRAVLTLLMLAPTIVAYEVLALRMDKSK